MNRMGPVGLQEIKELFETFLEDFGMTEDFRDYIEKRGYRMDELGFRDCDDEDF